MTGPESPGWTRSWDAAPVGLADLDPRGTIVAANTVFAAMIGSQTDISGTGVRWLDLLSTGTRLQYETQVAAVLHLSGSIDEVMVDLATTGGGAVPTMMSARVLRDGAGKVAGTRLALTVARQRRRFETMLIAARAAAEQANDDSARAQRRLEVQARATAALASSTTPEEAVRRLAAVFVADLADWCLIHLPDPTSATESSQWVALHTRPDQHAVIDRIAELLSDQGPAGVPTGGPTGASATLLEQVHANDLGAAGHDAELRLLLDQVDAASAIIAPSHAHGQQVAVVVLVRAATRAAFTEDDRRDVAEVAARAGIVIDNTRRYARERTDSLTLQQSLLTVPPPLPGFETVVHYQPAADHAQVGGDWYDVFVQPDGDPVIVVGDVVGHDIVAAAAMGRLRSTIRTIAHTVGGPPSDTLNRADRASRGLGTHALASAVLARIELPSDVAATSQLPVIRWSNAGHPPPMLLTRGGDVDVLERAPDILLGAVVSSVRHDHCVTLGVGDTLLLYTDGLIERAGENLDTGLARLASLLTAHRDDPLETLCDVLVEQMAATARHDDTALVAVRFSGTGAS